MGYASEYGLEQWRAAQRQSLAGSAGCADGKALAEARNRRMQGIWQETVRRIGRVGHGICAHCWPICLVWRRRQRWDEGSERWQSSYATTAR